MKRTLPLILSALYATLFVGCAHRAPVVDAETSTNTHTVFSAKTTLSKIDQRVPELESIAIAEGESVRHSSGWEGKENAVATFSLRGARRYHDRNDFAAGVPFIDVNVEIISFASATAADEAVQKSLFMRPAGSKKDSYQGGNRYRFTSGGATVIFQRGEYVIEISANNDRAMPFVPKVLESILPDL